MARSVAFYRWVYPLRKVVSYSLISYSFHELFSKPGTQKSKSQKAEEVGVGDEKDQINVQ